MAPCSTAELRENVAFSGTFVVVNGSAQENKEILIRDERIQVNRYHNSRHRSEVCILARSEKYINAHSLYG